MGADALLPFCLARLCDISLGHMNPPEGNQTDSFRKDPASVCSLQKKVTQKEESLGSILLEIWLEGGSVE